ncbi:hypothetical protein ACWGUN_23790 [Streptomyces koyangensis]
MFQTSRSTRSVAVTGTDPADAKTVTGRRRVRRQGAGHRQEHAAEDGPPARLSTSAPRAGCT